jgi:hypothetical protein
VNPLKLPWSQREKPKELKKKVPQFIGVRNEAVRDDADAEKKVVFSVRGLTSVPSGRFELAFVPGCSLRTYLTRLKLRHAATYAAVYDQSNLERGRCRMNYIPTADSHILIGPPGTSPMAHLQRSNGDPRPKKKGPRVEDVDITYKR